MKVSITFRHMKSSPAIKDYIKERLIRLDRYEHKAKDVHVILSMERYLHVAEVVLSAKKFRAQGKASTEDMYMSIDDAIAKVEKTLRRHRDKKIRAKTHATKEPVLLT